MPPVLLIVSAVKPVYMGAWPINEFGGKTRGRRFFWRRGVTNNTSKCSPSIGRSVIWLFKEN